MDTRTMDPVETGLEVLDLRTETTFLDRQVTGRNVAAQMEGMLRLAKAFVEHPETILQELVNAAVALCGAESAGISLEIENGTDEEYYSWVATAGEYSGFMNAKLPRYPSACGLSLERGRPQLFRVSQKFFDLMGVTAPIVREGILIPWGVDGTRGTIWIMAHAQEGVFDRDDLMMMEALANFAAMGVRQQRQLEMLRAQSAIKARAELANRLAHEINNPLQSLTNLVYLADREGENAELVEQMSENVAGLNRLVQAILTLQK